MNVNVKSRLRAAALHLFLSVVVAACCAALVFGLWYPPPYAVLAGGVGLFMLITSVDVVAGPLLTLVAFNVEKTRSHLRRDLLTISALQLAALAYGLHTVYEARPVLLAAENQLFRVVAANEVDMLEINSAPADMQSLSLTGPKLVGVRMARTGDEKLEAIERALEGFDGGARPSYWEPYEASRIRVQKQLRPMDQLGPIGMEAHARIEKLLQQHHKAREQVGFLPVKARAQDWIVLLDRSSGEILELVSTR
jgi:hypothetical protein